MMFVRPWGLLFVFLFGIRLISGNHKLFSKNKYIWNDDNQARQQYSKFDNSDNDIRNKYNLPASPVFTTPQSYQIHTICPAPIKCAVCTPNAVMNLTYMGLKRIGDSFISNPDIKELYLDDNEITNISVTAFTSLKQLKILSLSGNNISIGKMLWYKSHDTLQKLVLDNNKYNGSDTSIDEILEPLRRLQHLSLRRNGISQLNIVMKDFAPYLNSLDLSGNKLESINATNFPETIANLYMDDNKLTNLNLNNLNNINKLSLSGNKFQELCGVNCKHSWLSLKGKTKLSNLNVSHNSISTVKDDTFANTKNLVTLDLSHNNIVSIPNDIFIELSSLEDLRMNHNLLISIPNVCPLGYMKHLNVSNNRITEVMPSSFCRPMYLETLDLSNNYISTIKDDNFVNLQWLRWLDLSNNRIHKFPTILVRGMAYLHTLLLKNNSIDDINDLFIVNSNSVYDLHLEENPLLSLKINQNLTLHVKEVKSLHVDNVIDMNLIQESKEDFTNTKEIDYWG